MTITNAVMLSSEVIQSKFDFGGFFIGLLVVIALIVGIPIICCCVGVFGTVAAVNSANREPLVVNNNIRTEERREQRHDAGNYYAGHPGVYQSGYGNPQMNYTDVNYAPQMPYPNVPPMSYQPSPPMPYVGNQGNFSGPAYPPYPPHLAPREQRNPEPSAPYLNE